MRWRASYGENGVGGLVGEGGGGEEREREEGPLALRAARAGVRCDPHPLRLGRVPGAYEDLGQLGQDEPASR